MRRRPAIVATAVLLALPLAGCASPAGSPVGSAAGSPAGSPALATTSAAAPTTVVLQRGGGIAGARDAVTVRPDGGWRRTAKTGAPSTGMLSADQQARLARMAADPALRTEATRTVPGTECADGFDYRLTAGTTTVVWQDCGSATGTPVVASQIAGFLLNSTD
jgi:hypothetical protein